VTGEFWGVTGKFSDVTGVLSFRTGAAGEGISPFPHAYRYYSAPNLQVSMQLKQSTQRE